MESVYQRYDLGDGNPEFYVPVELATGEGRLHQELEQPRRPYSDVEAEMANNLSILPNFEARCRLIVGRRLGEYRLQALEPRGEPDGRAAEYIRG